MGKRQKNRRQVETTIQTMNGTIWSPWKDTPIIFAVLLFPSIVLLCAILYWIHIFFLE